MKNEIEISFGIWGYEDISHEDLTKLLNVNPSVVFIKGERKNPKFTAVAKQNAWIINSHYDKYTSFELQLGSILEFILSKKAVLKELSHKYYCEISCALYVYADNGESTPSIHLDSGYYDALSDLKIELDIDLYCLANI